MLNARSQKGKRPKKQESVIFVTATPSSELARNITKELTEVKIPVKVAENSGPKLSQILVNTNPHQQETSDKPGCMTCESRDGETKEV